MNGINTRMNQEILTEKLVSVAENGRLKIEKESGETTWYSFKELDFIF